MAETPDAPDAPDAPESAGRSANPGARGTGGAGGTGGKGRATRAGGPAKRRPLLLIGAGVVALALIVGGVVLLGGGNTATKVAKAAPSTATTLPAATTTTTPKESVVATTKVPTLTVYDAPNSSTVVTSLSAKTEYLQPRTLLVVQQQGDWLKTLLPIRPNGATGWVRASDVTLSQTPYEMRINLAEHKLTLYKAGQEVLSSPVVIGAPKTPTPLGTFYVTDPVDLRKTPDSAYGAYALGLSGYSEVLFEFNGGPGQIAVHGTNNPSQVGQDISNGCIRVPNDIIVQIAATVPLGTPVVIT